mmetsp:Transcript_25425/g.70226  ORF Transcript_25425/g.70226 Transcript_25425/m.70226 type:complete len:421 (-) Transcript_25425:409-1671(-)
MSSEQLQPPPIMMPAEWHPHAACIILYPHNPSTFVLDRARREVEQVARTIATVGQERVLLFCSTSTDNKDNTTSSHDNTSTIDELKRRLTDCPSVKLAICPSNDTWARDTSPTFVVEKRRQHDHITTDSSKLIGLDWKFNAYGGPTEGCYWPCDLDQQIASRICSALSNNSNLLLAPSQESDIDNNSSPLLIESRPIPLILEGGSIHTDGEGTILTTEECLLNPNRNPLLTKQQIEELVLTALGASKIIWLKHGLAFDDDTNGHVDNWACFVKPGHVVLSWTDNEQGDAENYQRCRQTLSQLQSCTDAKGRSLTVHKLYLPTPMIYTQQIVQELQRMLFNEELVPPRTVGERLAGSYVNFYIANQAVVVPQFGDATYDAKAIETLSQLFPDRTVVGVASRDILIGGGNIHCITQQVPRAT